MPIEIPATDLRNHQTEIINSVMYSNDNFIITHYGTAAAALISIQDFEILEKYKLNKLL